MTRLLCHRLLEEMETGGGVKMIGARSVALEDQREEILGTLRRRLLEAKKFFIHDDLVTFVDDNGLWNVATDMVAEGVMDLPFPHCVFEFEAIQGGSIFRKIVLARSVERGFSIETFGCAQGVYVMSVGASLVHYDGAGGGHIRAKTFFHASCPESEKPWIEEDNKWSALFILGALVALRADTTLEKENFAPRALNERRLHKGKPPLFEHTELHLRPELRTAEQGTIGIGGKRLHWRRGHPRRLGTERITWVRSHLVGDPELGCVSHDYTMRRA